MHQSAPNGVWTFELFTKSTFVFGLAWIGLGAVWSNMWPVLGDADYKTIS